MNYQEQYKQKYAQAMLDNFALVRDKLKQKDTVLLDKIKKRSAEYNIPKCTIIDEIMKYDTAVIPFVVSPARQNFYEKVAFSMIKSALNTENLINLPNNGLFVCNGVVIKKGELKQYPKAKTLDFKWNYNNYKIFASHKYTKDMGGSQDNQYKDLQAFIKEARDTKLDKTFFIAIADGDYYLTENGRAGTTKIQHLEDLCTGKIIACRMENLKEKIDILCKI